MLLNMKIFSLKSSFKYEVLPWLFLTCPFFVALYYWLFVDILTNLHFFILLLSLTPTSSFYLKVCLAKTFKRLSYKNIQPWDMRHVIDELPDAVIVRDGKDNIINSNSQARQMLAYDENTLSNLNLNDLDVDCYLRRHPHLNLDINLGQTVTYSTHFRDNHNKKIPVEVSTRNAVIGEKSLYIDVIRDVTERVKEAEKLSASKAELERARNKLESKMQVRSLELEQQIRNRKRAEQDIHEIRHLLSSLVDSMPSLIITIDKNYCVMQWNKRAEELVHLTEQEVVGKNLFHVLPDLYDHIVKASASLNDNTSAHIEKITAALKNKTLIVDMIIYSLQSPAPEGWVVRLDDVTEKVKLEETLVQTEKMLSLGGLAAGMAHEINNPLGGILQSSQNILRRLDLERSRNHEIASTLGVSLENVIKYLEKQRIIGFIEGIQKSGKRAANIVNDMLSFARPTRGDAMMMSLNNSLDASIRLAQSDYNQTKQLDFKKVQVIREFNHENIEVMAQKNQLEQVFLNLLINAAQAMTGPMQTEDPRIIVRLFKENMSAVIEFIDNGPGMDESVKRRIFEPFFTTKEEGSGTGLGLSVSYFIITEQMNGSMEVDTAVGRGTRFIIRLPLNSSIAKLTLKDNFT